jgi:RsiW-degrading membrane proteinase PrsW (M82 family)
MLWNAMMDFLESFFVYEGLTWDFALIALGLALAFGIIWLLAYWPPFFKNIWFLPVMIVSAFLCLLAITFVQIPLQYYANRAFLNYMSQTEYLNWYLLTAIPAILLSGLVQEIAKAVPVFFWWWRSGKTISPRMGLIIGAVAGAGFGIFEGFWAHGSVLAAGWTIDAISQAGFDGIAPFWERFFTIGFHIAASALVGYGIAKGKWWQYYLIAAALHALLNYSSVVFTYFVYIQPLQDFKTAYVEGYIALGSLILTAVVLYLRWRKDEVERLLAELPPPSDTAGTTTPPGTAA